MASKRRLAHLENARLASVAHSKEQKLERIKSPNTEQPRINDNELNTSNTAGDTDVDMEEEGTWVWQMRWNLTRNVVGSLMKKEIWDLKGPGLKRKPPPQKQPKEIKWGKMGKDICAEYTDKARAQPFIERKKP